jgi:predicted ATPase/Tfp pilus assembly protein PilF
MGELAEFREHVRAYRRAAGRSQQQLATAIGIHPNVLSHKLNRHGQAVLTTPEVIRIVTTLAEWGALEDRAAAERLLASAGVPVHAIPAAAWAAPPLSVLPAAANTAERRPPPAPSGSRTAADAGRLRLTRLLAPRTPLIGRHDERRDIARALDGARLITLTGVGGTGKTRLAVQVAADVANRYPDGVGFVDLSVVRDPALLATAVAIACGLAPAAATDAEAVLIDALTDQHLLLVVDNVEHLVEGAAALGRLLAAAPGLQVLATSRVALRIYGEHTVRVPPLALTGRAPQRPEDSEAVQLFIERASAARHDFAPTLDDLSVISEICRTVDGLPLAIELAAAKTRTYALRELLLLLQSRVSVLSGGPRDAPDRQRTLRATLDWSFALLSLPAQRLLGCVGIFAGRFDIAAAAAVSDEPEEATVGELLDELSEHSMVEIRSGAGPRFALLHTVREYALARLAERGDEEAVERRNLGHHLAQARALPAPAETGRSNALTLLEAAYPNIRVALDYAHRAGDADPDCLTDGLLLATAVGPLWRYRGPLAEGRLYLQRLLDVERGRVDAPTRAGAVLQLCALTCFAGDYEIAVDYSRQCIELFQQLDDPRGLARAYRYRGECAYAVGDLDTATAMFEQALQIARSGSDPEGDGQAANMLGQLLRHQGALDDARAHLRHAVASFIRANVPTGVGSTLHSLAEVSRDQGNLDEAESLVHAAMRIADSTGDTRSLAYSFEALAGLASLRGDSVQALRRLGTAQAIRERVGARLAPVDQDTLQHVMAVAFADTSAAEQQSAFAEARTIPLEDEIRDVLSQAIPVIASGTDDDLTAWIKRLISDD